ncbi:hypothetical protein EVAR_34765_1 [Eumeta japonica]|uniref:Uncharacterized protein n=1 Tax=Eumeta variegata TaxID=151549 RepID=A0A4C1ZHU9_EUMVA|nr:hypothetical protein EVAR_34765_1 [Eumeta japonica]
MDENLGFASGTKICDLINNGTEAQHEHRGNYNSYATSRRRTATYLFTLGINSSHVTAQTVICTLYGGKWIILIMKTSCASHMCAECACAVGRHASDARPRRRRAVVGGILHTAKSDAPSPRDVGARRRIIGAVNRLCC